MRWAGWCSSSLVGSLFPLAVGPDAELLLAIGPGVVWVAALLAVMISLHRLFQPDLDDGALEQMVLSPHSLAGIVGAKMAAHWLVCCLPLVAVAPLMALQFGLLGADAVAVLLVSLLLGTPTLSCWARWARR